ncbi:MULTISPECIES: arylsulfatase [unclassified Ensifer]|uniref:arylsulfatase n=1 Tax=unclassified Ensifer TaxID=2633371 RepID=UPI0009F164AF|nr:MULTISPECIES: arylsulfatase [unclassified Ensifer]
MLAAAAIVAGGLGLTAAQAPLVPAAQAQDAAKPNILVIMADDIGWMNVSSYGGDIMGVKTPNIDRIGEEGLRLTSFYAQPSCTAGRAAFLTGQLPVRTGMTTVGTPGSPAGLQAEDITIAEVLKSAGYATAQFGKSHLGDLDAHLPCNHGFDEYFGNLYHLNANEDLEDPDRPENPEFRAKYDPRGVVSCTAGGPVKDEGPLTTERMETFDEEALGKSIKYLDDRAKDGKPFFLWHNPTRMHVFLHLKDERKGVSRAGSQDVYGDGLAELDDHVGQLLAELDKTGLSKNTIVVFTTDNGAYQYMWPEGGTTPFRGDKGTTWEGGVRAPFVVRWPGASGRRVSSEIVDMTDLMPTIAAAAGVDDLAPRLAKGASFNGKDYKVHLDGFDQGAFFRGEQENSNRKFVFYYDETVLTAIRYGYYKVTFSAKEGGKWDSPLQSYGRPLITNLRMDPFERQDGDINRQLSEHKTWALTPIVNIAVQHLASFKEFPIRQLGMSADVGKTIEGVQSQILRLQQTQ